MINITSFLEFPLLSLGETTVTMGQVVAVCLFILIGVLFVLWSTRLFRKLLRRRSVGKDLIQILSRAYLFVAWVVLGLITLDILSIPLTAFAFISGAIAIGFGFGAQNIINNFISGWILMWERPIKIGDVLELGDLRGSVESINIRSTRIRRRDGVHVLVPNSYLLENIVTNWTHRDQLVRSTVVLGVAHGSDLEKVTSLLERAAAKHPGVLDAPSPYVLFEDFAESTLTFELIFWINLKTGEGGPRRVMSELRYSIHALFGENDISLSFPQRDVHVDGHIAIKAE